MCHHSGHVVVLAGAAMLAVKFGDNTETQKQEEISFILLFKYISFEYVYSKASMYFDFDLLFGTEYKLSGYLAKQKSRYIDSSEVYRKVL